jgi:hypothetical protein
MGGGRTKGEWWREWIQLWYIVRTSVNTTMYPSTRIIKKKLKISK